MATDTPGHVLSDLFPLPVQSGTSYSPTQNPGVTDERGKALVALLKDNHDKFHIFFNEKGYHNHATHHLYAIYALGASPSLLEAAYATHVDTQRPSFDSPDAITSKNWKDHFGDENYYRAYMKFFADETLANGIAATLETFIFAYEANYGSSKDPKNQPEMVNRLLSGLLHPFIHSGHAAEFEAPGMLAEGLAMTCVTHTDKDGFIPQTLFIQPTVGTLTRLTAALTFSSPPKKHTHAFTIVARMLKDHELGPRVACKLPVDPEASDSYTETLDRRGDLINKYVSEWEVDTADPSDVRAKLQEISWVVVLLYGVAGLQPGREFNADFFKMHLVTSSLFLRSYLKHIKPQSQKILLKSYLATALGVWVSRGRPEVDILNFYKVASANPVPPGQQPTPSKDALDPTHLTPNPWYPLLQSTIQHPNEHLPKAQRALAHYAAEYGTTARGRWAGTELEGAEELDGTLFERVAGLTMNRLGWAREGQEKHGWDVAGFWE
ncbi:hypothetical protein BD410DRAFT_793062 [Rickenella mellea]|uniref:Oxidoreductase AflY n=1 Tax=Rickenella mellea TaxID=50990 RepID=A0A4Y7PTF2_9AGAM|nr:hypothetical protein BD410DRAFT_793062 [Rickenella mellea]